MQITKNNGKFLFDKDTLLHLRIPFSFFLLPVFCFALSQVSLLNVSNTIVIFIALHFLIYPASNAYNSFMDEDTGSIGGLKKPPPVTKKLFYASIVLDAAGLTVCLLINGYMLLLMAIYICVSKIYSWKKTRIKKYPLTGWLLVMLFQGGYTFLLVHAAAENNFTLSWFTNKNLESMLFASLLIGGFYPLTQIYQHAEDSRRGDITISYKLGIAGTFAFTAALFVAACITAYHYFITYYNAQQVLIFFISLLPVIIYFTFWFAKTVKNKSLADYEHTMRITFISSVCMIICFGILFYLNNA